MKSICVFCGSRNGGKEIYSRDARKLGQLLAERRIQLIYGGSRLGLMGSVADAALDSQGDVIGVIPELLVEKEVAHSQLTHLEIVGSMHARKQKMYDLSDGFIALPGGFGTLDELCEVLTWGQLQVHHKPTALLNTAGFYNPLLEHLNHGRLEGFISPQTLDGLIVEETPEALLERLVDAPAGKERIDSSFL